MHILILNVPEDLSVISYLRTVYFLAFDKKKNIYTLVRQYGEKIYTYIVDELKLLPILFIGSCWKHIMQQVNTNNLNVIAFSVDLYAFRSFVSVKLENDPLKNKKINISKRRRLSISTYDVCLAHLQFSKLKMNHFCVLYKKKKV